MTPSRFREKIESSEKVSQSYVDSTTTTSQSYNSLQEKLGNISSIQSIVGNWSLDGFSMSKPLGKGKFGNVYQAKQRGSNHSVALKVIFKAQMQNSMAHRMLKREVEIQYRLQHENILNLYGYFQDAKNLYLILEFAEGGEYTKYLAQYGHTMSETVCRAHMGQVLSGLAHMHNRHVMHRDIKPENILIDKEGRLKIADLGSSVHMPPTITLPATSLKRYTMCGTPEYLAPEMIRCEGHNSSVDIWAVGILMYEIMYKRTPFTDNIQVVESHKKRKRDSFEDNSAIPTTGDDAGAMEMDEQEKENLLRKKLYHRILSYVDGNLMFEFSHCWLTKQLQQNLNSSNMTTSVPDILPAYRQQILRLLRSDARMRPSASEALSLISETSVSVT
jgi:serine/threonine protein kinase